MTIQEAIDILTKWTQEESMDDEVKLHQAELLLIEAGKRIQKGRATFDEHYPTLLPGETQE